MSIDSIALVTIVGMALGTYMTRAGGFWLVSRLTPSRFLTSTLQYLPGTMLIAPVAPELAKGGADRIVASYFHRPDYVAIWKPDAGAYWGHRSRLVVEIGGGVPLRLHNDFMEGAAYDCPNLAWGDPGFDGE